MKLKSFLKNSSNLKSCYPTPQLLPSVTFKLPDRAVPEVGSTTDTSTIGTTSISAESNHTSDTIVTISDQSPNIPNLPGLSPPESIVVTTGSTNIPTATNDNSIVSTVLPLTTSVTPDLDTTTLGVTATAGSGIPVSAATVLKTNDGIVTGEARATLDGNTITTTIGPSATMAESEIALISDSEELGEDFSTTDETPTMAESEIALISDSEELGEDFSTPEGIATMAESEIVLISDSEELGEDFSTTDETPTIAESKIALISDSEELGEDFFTLEGIETTDDILMSGVGISDLDPLLNPESGNDDYYNVQIWSHLSLGPDEIVDAIFSCVNFSSNNAIACFDYFGYTDNADDGNSNSGICGNAMFFASSGANEICITDGNIDLIEPDCSY